MINTIIACAYRVVWTNIDRISHSSAHLKHTRIGQKSPRALRQTPPIILLLILQYKVKFSFS